MKYSVKLLGIVCFLSFIILSIVSFFKEGQESTNYLILGLLLLIIGHVHMLEQTIINNYIRPDKIVISLNGKTTFKLSNSKQVKKDELLDLYRKTHINDILNADINIRIFKLERELSEESI